MKLRGLLLGAAALALAAPLAARAADAPSCTSAPCHEKLVKKKVVHAATESCDGCHTATGGSHPQKGKKTFKLAGKEAELCANCHDAFGKKPVVHPPVKDGSCTTCHDPHSSDEAKLLSAPMKELCGTCHSDKVDFKLPHGPVSAGDCTACHNPHETQEKKLLVKAGEQICFGCHTDMTDMLKKKVVHAAVEGGCTSCHNPHGAANPKLLAEPGANLCFGCHSELGEKVKLAVVHAPIKTPKGCASCHSPHSADAAKLLPTAQKELCLGCHKNVIDKSMTVLHAPIAKGDCAACHDPHGSANARLLVKGFPKEPYVPYTEKEFELCFSCHKRDLLQFPDTSFATNFRDGDRNLHFLHVNNKLKGRSCKLCHAMHGATNALLIAEKVPFGGWSLPIKFEKFENGGSCAPGCHKPLVYNRKTPGKRDEAPKPPAPAAGKGAKKG